MNLGEGKWKNASGGIQLYLLLATWFLGLICTASISSLLFEGITSADSLRISNAIGSILLFLLPASIYGFLFADHKGHFLISQPVVLKILLLAIMMIICIQPFVETVNHYNNLITFPESMSSLNEFFKQMKESGEKTFALLFADKSISNLLVNIFILAILPGIVEELFFRGCMQRAVFKINGNPHTAVWITAIIFSFLHFQLAGLFPRIILGAALGYLYTWTKNIWIPILVHITHNAVIVIVAQMLVNNEFYKKISISDYSFSNAGIAAIISLILTIALMYIICRLCPVEKERNQ